MFSLLKTNPFFIRTTKDRTSVSSQHIPANSSIPIISPLILKNKPLVPYSIIKEELQQSYLEERFFRMRVSPHNSQVNRLSVDKVIDFEKVIDSSSNTRSHLGMKGALPMFNQVCSSSHFGMLASQHIMNQSLSLSPFLSAQRILKNTLTASPLSMLGAQHIFMNRAALSPLSMPGVQPILMDKPSAMLGAQTLLMESPSASPLGMHGSSLPILKHKGTRVALKKGVGDLLLAKFSHLLPILIPALFISALIWQCSMNSTLHHFYEDKVFKCIEPVDLEINTQNSYE